MKSYRGMTWDHPRGTDALRAAAAKARDVGLLDITWDAQPLEGFESHPIEDLAARYEMIVLDHPHLGDAIQHDCLVPLDEIFDPVELQTWADAAIGETFSSYRMGGRQWALPLDAATQVLICAPALADEPMETWDDIVSLSDEVSVALSLAGPHAALSFFSICNGLGAPVATDLDAPLITNTAAAGEAFGIMSAIAARMAPEFWSMNPIGLHEAVAADQLGVCPLLYGYAPYGRPTDEPGRQSVHFGNAPRVRERRVIGTTLGGTGICITKRTSIGPDLLDHIRTLMSPTVQTTLFPENSGQPYHVRAWSDPQINRAYGGFYQSTRKSLEQAWVRPRWAGYTAFQLELSALIRSALEDRQSSARAIDRINDLAAAVPRPAMYEV